uniref:Protein cramped-like n=1 Tax=Aceria tosichella TaxID=561515 RepID=A0A6G1SMS8_9ACAR
MTTSIKFRALTDEDHKLFFEALGEHGKDFQNIQQYMAQRGGQKNNNASNGGNNNNNNNSNNNRAENNKLLDAQERKELDKKEDDRKREQIRNFYNKLYAKLSELIGKIDDRVEKVNQELYLLINYGEIWKRNGFKFNSKTKRLLEELVYQGTTTFRYEKKNVRLRTPTCKALKKINEIGVDEKVKVVTTKELPKDVIVEFHPATNRDWLKVQSLSQNPRVRARLSMQKRLTSILSYLENKWDVSQDKLNRTLDVWLKVSSSNSQSCESNTNNLSDNKPSSDGQSNQPNYYQNDIQQESQSKNSIHQRIRLKPSDHHELKEVNITRVVPDNHLDLSLNAYLKRLEASVPKDRDQANGKNNQQNNQNVRCDTFEFSSVTTTTASHLPVSLTTPDCSILLERSCTSDQPSIAQARKHLNILQSLTGSLEGCENSRTAYEDTQDRSLMNMLMNQNSRSVGFAPNEPNMSVDHEQQRMHPNPTIYVNNDIPALYDEDAALPVSSQNAIRSDTSLNSNHMQASLPSSDSQNSKLDFQIPKNVTLGDYFKMTGPHNDSSPIGDGSDEAANDAFPLGLDRLDEESDPKEMESEYQYQDLQTKDNCGLANGQVKPQNHMIEIKKFANGWTSHDEPTLTLGELYLAFKCPEKIILEYEFEQYTYENSPKEQREIAAENSPTRADSPKNTSTRVVQDNSSDRILIFKLLTAASLSLTQIERKKQDQQHKLQESQQSSCSKLKRRKGSGQGQTMTLHDIEATNQRVEEALKQLQPTRLSSYRRAR